MIAQIAIALVSTSAESARQYMHHWTKLVKSYHTIHKLSVNKYEIQHPIHTVI